MVSRSRPRRPPWRRSSPLAKLAPGSLADFAAALCAVALGQKRRDPFLEDRCRGLVYSPYCTLVIEVCRRFNSCSWSSKLSRSFVQSNAPGSPRQIRPLVHGAGQPRESHGESVQRSPRCKGSPSARAATRCRSSVRWHRSLANPNRTGSLARGCECYATSNQSSIAFCPTRRSN